MYHSNFLLARRLFDGATDQPAGGFLAASRRRIVENFTQSLSQCDSVVVVTGAPGIGKTTLALRALEELHAPTALGCIESRPRNAAQLLEIVLDELGVDVLKSSPLERLTLWHDLNKRLAAAGTRVVLLVENTQDLDRDVLMSLAEITRATGPEFAGANLVLTGRPGLETLLCKPEYAPLSRRITLRTSVGPLNAEEMRAHFLDLARRAGSRGSIFGPGSLEMLHCYAGGVPRVAQYLCEMALGLSSSRKEAVLSAKTVRDVAMDLHVIRSNELAGGPARVLPVQRDSATRTANEQVLDIDNSDGIPTLSEVVGMCTPTQSENMAFEKAPNDDQLEEADRQEAELQQALAENARILHEQSIKTRTALRLVDEVGYEGTDRSLTGAERASRVNDAWGTLEHVSAMNDGDSLEAQPLPTSAHEGSASALKPHEEPMVYDEDAYEAEIEAALRAAGEDVS
jgi:general secretion pathway protein A